MPIRFASGARWRIWGWPTMRTHLCTSQKTTWPSPGRPSSSPSSSSSSATKRAHSWGSARRRRRRRRRLTTSCSRTCTAYEATSRSAPPRTHRRSAVPRGRRSCGRSRSSSRRRISTRRPSTASNANGWRSDSSSSRSVEASTTPKLRPRRSPKNSHRSELSWQCATRPPFVPSSKAATSPPLPIC